MATGLAGHFVAMAGNNAWSNHRLLGACKALTPEEFAAPRTGFFPSLRATLQPHPVGRHLLHRRAAARSDGAEALRRSAAGLRRRAPRSTTPRRASDRRLIAFCERQTEASLAEGLVLPRPNRTPPPTSVASILEHLFQHQIHHRGQAHAMLSSTPVKPPQLDEFFLAGEEHLRRDELLALGLPTTLMRPRSSFAGAAIEVSDLARSVAFHRLWLPMLGFRRVWASPDRVMWSRGYDHFVMRQAKDGVSYGPGALWLAVSAESRAQVDQVYRRAARRRGRDPAAAQGARLLRAGLLLGRLPRSRRRADRGRASLGRAARRWPTPSRCRCRVTASPWAATSSSRRPASRPIRR